MSMLVQSVRSMFDLPSTPPPDVRPVVMPELGCDPGTILLITGPSGSGKSQLLASLKRRHADGVGWIEPGTVRLGDAPVIDVVCGQIDPDDPQRAIEKALALLSCVGLAEAWTYLRRPCELSDGQRWRLVLGLMIARAKESKGTAIIAMDEFAALLDRVTAMIVARSLRKRIDRGSGVCAIVVTSHDDLVDALRPDIRVECDFGEYRVTSTPRA